MKIWRNGEMNGGMEWDRFMAVGSCLWNGKVNKKQQETTRNNKKLNEVVLVY